MAKSWVMEWDDLILQNLILPSFNKLSLTDQVDTLNNLDQKPTQITKNDIKNNLLSLLMKGSESKSQWISDSKKKGQLQELLKQSKSMDWSVVVVNLFKINSPIFMKLTPLKKSKFLFKLPNKPDYVKSYTYIMYNILTDKGNIQPQKNWMSKNILDNDIIKSTSNKTGTNEVDAIKEKSLLKEQLSDPNISKRERSRLDKRYKDLKIDFTRKLVNEFYTSSGKKIPSEKTTLNEDYVKEYQSVMTNLLELYEIDIKESEEKVLEEYKSSIATLKDNKKVKMYTYSDGRRFFVDGTYSDGSLILKDVDIHNMFVEKTETVIPQKKLSYQEIYGKNPDIEFSVKINQIREMLVNNEVDRLTDKDFQLLKVYRSVIFERFIIKSINDIYIDLYNNSLYNVTPNKLCLLRMDKHDDDYTMSVLKGFDTVANGNIVLNGIRNQIREKKADELDERELLFVQYFMYLFKTDTPELIKIKRLILKKLDNITCNVGTIMIPRLDTEEGIQFTTNDTPPYSYSTKTKDIVPLNDKDMKFIKKYLRDNLQFKRNIEDIVIDYENKFVNTIQKYEKGFKRHWGVESGSQQKKRMLEEKTNKLYNEIFQYTNKNDLIFVKKYLNDEIKIDEQSVDKYGKIVQNDYDKKYKNKFESIVEKDSELELYNYLFDINQNKSVGGIDDILTDKMYNYHDSLKFILSTRIPKYQPFRMTLTDIMFTNKEQNKGVKQRIYDLLSKKHFKTYFLGDSGKLYDRKSNLITTLNQSHLKYKIIAGNVKKPIENNYKEIFDSLLKSMDLRNDTDEFMEDYKDDGEGDGEGQYEEEGYIDKDDDDDYNDGNYDGEDQDEEDDDDDDDDDDDMEDQDDDMEDQDDDEEDE
jgi:hypothetical protein